MDRKEVAAALREIGLLLELSGENPFRCRAYERAARSIENAEEEVGKLVAESRLTDLDGVGKKIAEKVATLVGTGGLPYLENLRSKLPSGLLDMVRIPGMGPKKAMVVHKELGVATLHELSEAARSGQLQKLKGFGRRTEENIIVGLELLQRSAGRYLFSEAHAAAGELFERVRSHPDCIKASVAGSLRRKRETVKDIDIVCAARKVEGIAEAFVSSPGVERVTARGATKTSVIMRSGIACDLRLVKEEEYPFALHHFTGSKDHNVAMRTRAQKSLGIKMNEYGLFRGDERLACATEVEVFRALGLKFIPPELRENLGEIEAAEKGELPALVEDSDVKGSVHVHSSYSDGLDAIERLCEAAKELGHSYLGVCDHSVSAGYAGGLKPEELKRQHKEIDALNRRLAPFHALKGIECDILADGSLDYPEEVLATFDFVVASIHSRFKMEPDEMTERLLRAVRNPYTTVLGHPSGRLLLQRNGYAFDEERVLRACAETGTAVEMNANPNRLDLDWRLARRAKNLGVKLCIASDAHGAASLADYRYGAGIARKGWIEKKDIINCLDAEGFVAFARAKSGRAPEAARPRRASRKAPSKRHRRKGAKKAPKKRGRRRKKT